MRQKEVLRRQMAQLLQKLGFSAERIDAMSEDEACAWLDAQAKLRDSKREEPKKYKVRKK